jgi:chromosome segregation ATPase
MSTVESHLGIEHEDDIGGPVAPLNRRAPRISQADVFQAADELLLEGHRPTIDRVRMRLGRGSPNTINDHLDAWWAKLGARLRDLPGREFPHLPERVAQALQRLWNEALQGAHEALQATLIEREHTLEAREGALQSRARQFEENEHATLARAAVLEESIGLAREQLSAANQRAERLETHVQERDTECSRLRARIEALEASAAEFRTQLEAARTAHQADRTRLEERYTAAEAHWLTEVDRARQTVKEVAKEQERQVKEIRGQMGSLQAERDQLRQYLTETRSELKTATAVREQIEERLRAATRVSGRAPSRAKSKRKGSYQPRRSKKRSSASGMHRT